MCIPAKFPLKSLACQALISRSERLGEAEEDVTPSTILEIQRLLKIVDEVLGVELCPVEDQPPLLEEQSLADPACDSCGGEIFQASFICSGTCLRGGKTQAPGENAMIICPSCFVEGRTCGCGTMEPLYVREIGPFVEARDKADNFVRENAEIVFLSERELARASTPSIFMAALLLRQKRSRNHQVGQYFPLTVAD